MRNGSVPGIVTLDAGAAMETPYGPCHHTHYEGGPPCIHSAYLRGFEDGRNRRILKELIEEAQDAGLYDGER